MLAIVIFFLYLYTPIFIWEMIKSNKYISNRINKPFMTKAYALTVILVYLVLWVALWIMNRFDPTRYGLLIWFISFMTPVVCTSLGIAFLKSKILLYILPVVVLFIDVLLCHIFL